MYTMQFTALMGIANYRQLSIWTKPIRKLTKASTTFNNNKLLPIFYGWLTFSDIKFAS